MLIYLLNLDRSKERLAEFVAANRHLSEVSRVPAVDGASLDLPGLIKQGVIADGLVAKDFYTIGALGAAFSHVSLWQTAIEADQPVTVVEDDAILHSQFETLAPQALQRLPADWDFVLWGFNFDLFMSFEMLPGVSYCLAQFDQERLRANVATFQTQPIEPRLFKLNWSFGICCYTVSAKGARALMEKCLPLAPTVAPFPPAMRVQLRAGHFRNVGIDSAMNNAWASLNAFVCFPPLVVTKNDASRSTIQPVG